MRAYCENCGTVVEVLTRRHWRFSSSVVPCPQFRHYLCMHCKQELPDFEIDKVKNESRKMRKIKVK